MGSTGGAVVSTPHSKKVLSLRALPMWVSSVCSGFLPQSGSTLGSFISLHCP